MDAFSAAVGTRQGRLEPDGQGEFVIGSSEPGWLADATLPVAGRSVSVSTERT
jgi:hypothetical protein